MGASIDPESLELGLAMLPEELRAVFSEALEPRWKARARRLEMRDIAIREAAELFSGRGPTAAARAVSHELSRVIAGRPTSAPELFARIATLNCHRRISARQIEDIARGDRTPTR